MSFQPWVETKEHSSWYGKSLFSFVKYCQTVFQCSCTILCSQQQWMRAFVAPQPCQHLVSSVFQIMTILMGVEWYLTVILICIFLMTVGKLWPTYWFGRKVITNLGRVLKSRDITLPTKVHLVKAMVFPVVMYRCESWTVKKVEQERIDAFELWCWRRLLRVPWTARRSNQFILREISPGCSLEGLMLKLKLQYFGHLMQRADSF